jgi:homocysteine S-methyltransferase
MRLATTKKLSAQPNAGLPRDVQGRQFYMCSPEYMAKYAKRLIQAGVRFIGGCCGTTPAHIKLISDAVRPLSPRHTGITGKLASAARVEAASAPPEVEAVPLAERSHWGWRTVC